MAKLAWKERYNCHSFELARGLSLGIVWSMDKADHAADMPWKASVFGNGLVKRFKDFDVAEDEVIRIARSQLQKALNALPDGGGA